MASKYYTIKLNISEQELYEIIPLLPEKIADDIIDQTEEKPVKYQSKEYFQEYWRKNRDKIIKQQKAWRKKNIKHVKEYQKRYRETHKAQAKQYWLEHKEEIKWQRIESKMKKKMEGKDEEL